MAKAKVDKVKQSQEYKEEHTPGYREVGAHFPPAYDWEGNAELEGIILSRHQAKSKKMKKEKTVYIIVDTNGVEHSVWGTGHLDYLLREVKDETAVKIRYEGTTKVEGIKQPVHKFRVWIKEGK